MKDKSLIFAVIGCSLTGVFGITCLVASSSFTYRHPQGENFEVRRDGRVVRRREKLAESLLTAATAGAPKAVARQTEHDFGIMDRLTMGRHAFVIRNEGDAPLRIRKGPTTCKCTLSQVARNEVLPGQEVAVTLDWNTGRDRFYSHAATIYTDDPDHRTIHLGIHGTVRMKIGTVPEKIHFDDLRPDQPSTAEVVVYSQVWDSFEIVGGSSTHDGITWSVQVADDEQLEDMAAARRVLITLPAGMPSGVLSEHLEFTVQPASGEPATLNLPITGKVPRRLAVFGKGISSDGVIDLGQIRQGEGLTRRFLLKMRDDERDLIATRIECVPTFVSAAVVPYEGTTQDAGLATLEVTLPPDSPACSYLGVPLGSLRIEFDHPRIPSLDLKVKFAVVARARKEG